MTWVRVVGQDLADLQPCLNAVQEHVWPKAAVGLCPMLKASTEVTEWPRCFDFVFVMRLDC